MALISIFLLKEWLVHAYLHTCTHTHTHTHTHIHYRVGTLITGEFPKL